MTTVRGFKFDSKDESFDYRFRNVGFHTGYRMGVDIVDSGIIFVL